MAKYIKAFVPIGIGFLMTLALLQHPLPVWACAAVGPENTHVQVVDEAAIIVWDAETHQEHFIRRATFNATSRDFGFLVPTPSIPKLAEANDSAFQYLDQRIAPRVIVDKTHVLTSLLLSMLQPKTAAVQMIEPSTVHVLGTQHIAGYDAVVLSASKAGDLLKWLATHGYVARPAFRDWLTPYVKAHWIITAFKISNAPPNYTRIASSAVQMSFTTSRPFFPYREPADQREPGHYTSARSLRVYLLSSVRMEGVLGQSGASSSWPGKVVAANPIAVTDRTALALELALSAEQFSGSLWLTAMEDHSAPRLGTDDIYFSLAAQQTPVVPPPVIRTQRIGIPVEPFLLVGGLLWIRLRCKQRRSRLKGFRKSQSTPVSL